MINFINIIIVYQNQNGKFEADFINVKVWKDVEKYVEELDKGQKVHIKAHTQTGSYQNDKGEKVYTTDLVADEIEYDLKKEIKTKRLKIYWNR